MLYSLILNFVDQYSFLNVFKYLTFRTGLAMFTSMVVVLLIGIPFIKFFSIKQIIDPIRADGPTDHVLKKIGTPTMGGVLILLGLFSGILLCPKYISCAWAGVNRSLSKLSDRVSCPSAHL